MEMTSHPEWHDEQERVDGVAGEIDRRIQYLESFANQMKADVVEIRRNFWDDVTVNFDDPNESAETYTSIRQQAEVLADKERSHHHAEDQLRTLKRLRRSPYFGRIDFVEDGARKADTVYLGTGSFRDETGDEHLIYDWRAPISSLYYDYQPGPVRYQSPMGEVSGTMERKRQYVIRDGRIHSLFDANLTIGDELLREVLGQQADGQMKSIVGTIQAAQNRIIRNEKSRLIVVEGAAGSGKTSTALQRIAYLLYRHRNTLRSDHIVLFSPNPIFKSYVSTVLPELGEENMQQTTFQEYLEHRLSADFEVDDPFNQFEYVHTRADEPGYAARMAGIRYKSSAAFMHMLDEYVERLGSGGLAFKPIRFRGEPVVTADRITDAFYSLDPSWSIPNRMQTLTTWLWKEVKAYARQERSKAWVDEEIELLDKEDYAAAYQTLRRKNQFTQESFNDHARERDWLADMVIQRYLTRVRSRVKRFRFLDIRKTYLALYRDGWRTLNVHFDESVRSHWQSICAQTVEQIQQGRLPYEDMTPFLYLTERIVGFQSNLSVRHVFIDEAQDFSPFQFVFIKHLFPRSRVTVLGDSNQAIYVHASDAFGRGWLEELYGEAERFVLVESYRSTRQIVEFTRLMIPNGERIQPFHRDGALPVLSRVDSVAELHQKIAGVVESLRQEGHQHIAIICKTAEESLAAYADLSTRIPLQLIGKNTASFRAGTVVIPSCLAKGVEFDAVIVYDGSSRRYGAQEDRRLLYTVCTRAMHVLCIFFVGDVSPLLADIHPECYEIRESPDVRWEGGGNRNDS